MNIVFKKSSNIDSILVENNYPVQLIVDKDSRVKINDIVISPRGYVLEKNKVTLDGDFYETQLRIGNSVILEVGNNFRLKNPIRTSGSLFNATIRLIGDFTHSSEMIFNTNITIAGDLQIAPKGALINIFPSSPNTEVSLIGNLSECCVAIHCDSYVLCKATLGHIIIKENLQKVKFSLASEAKVNSIDIWSPIEIEGDEIAVRTFIENSHSHALGEIITRGVFKDVFVKDGIAHTSTSIDKPGKYILSIKAKQSDNIETLKQKLPVIINHKNDFK